MSVLVESDRIVPELGVRSERTFSVEDLAQSTDTIGRFRLAPKILSRTGSTGVVFAAHDEGAGANLGNEMVVVKIGYATGPQALHHAYEEAAMARKAAEATSGVPRVVDSWVEPLTIQTINNGILQSDFSVTVMEYIPGETLASKIENEGPLGVAETIKILGPVGDTLDKLHGVGVSHRDTNPGNIIVNQDSGGTLVDFDIAFRGDLVADANSMVGTPGFIAPEEYDFGETVTRDVDGWKLTATAYTAITADRLIPGKTIVGAMPYMLGDGYVTHVSQKLKVLTPRVQGVMRRALEADPGERFLNNRAFINALDKAHQKDMRPPSRLRKATTVFSRRRAA